MDTSLLLRLTILMNFGRAMLLDRSFAYAVLQGLLPVALVIQSRKTSKPRQ